MSGEIIMLFWLTAVPTALVFCLWRIGTRIRELTAAIYSLPATFADHYPPDEYEEYEGDGDDDPDDGEPLPIETPVLRIVGQP